MSGQSRRAVRHRAREAALKLLYQHEVGGGDLEPAIERFWTLHRRWTAERRFADPLVRGTLAKREVIDAIVERSGTHWRLSRMAIVDRLILRLAVFELLQREIPPAVVIDEAVELAKAYSADGAGAFVNGVLDGARRLLEATGTDRTALPDS